MLYGALALRFSCSNCSSAKGGILQQMNSSACFQLLGFTPGHRDWSQAASGLLKRKALIVTTLGLIRRKWNPTGTAQYRHSPEGEGGRERGAEWHSVVANQYWAVPVGSCRSWGSSAALLINAGLVTLSALNPGMDFWPPTFLNASPCSEPHVSVSDCAKLSIYHLPTAHKPFCLGQFHAGLCSPSLSPPSLLWQPWSAHPHPHSAGDSGIFPFLLGDHRQGAPTSSVELQGGGRLCLSQSPRMAWVAQELNAHLVPTPCYVQVANQQPRLPRATSSLASNACRDGASTASLGNLCQCLTTLCV
ncbi:uncharacterized protein LOC125691180 [Lagopus muta]|uniref:uncharacterized protein LOC125691180 n=1 Tax=Lagopus muta TaxID=64668 RepID=UPI0020A03C21|nr:uncharacterized protein LOC125691180 [Lagopus muta]XP_048796175.1 uncharacterized protein LOC125691180 [Lagopus muta]XP_048796177.1 uncharacterized protein LOC125691180 [Lagopus muta]